MLSSNLYTSSFRCPFIIKNIFNNSYAMINSSCKIPISQIDDKLFIDTDIILDIALTRETHFHFSAIVFSLIESKSVIGYTSSVIVSNIYYIIRKIDSHKSAIDFISKLRILINILPVDDEIICLALESHFKDFEDAIQYYCAYKNKIDYLITRNVKDYSKAQMKVHTPEEYLKLKNITSSLDTDG